MHETTRAPIDPRVTLAYTLLISSVPALLRAWRQSPNETARRLNRHLHNEVVAWCLEYQRLTGRGDQGLELIP